MIHKYILIGSAPYVVDHWQKIKEFYLFTGFLPVAINNAWKVVGVDDLHEWFLPDDFLDYSPNTGIKCGHCLPRSDQLEKLNISFMADCDTSGYVCPTGGCMALNVMHILFNRHKGEDLRLVVCGSDFIYEPGKINHFYGDPKLNPTVQDYLNKNNPDLVGINADPLRFGDDWLNMELHNVKSRYEQAGSSIFVETPLKETRLPFPRYISEIG